MQDAPLQINLGKVQTLIGELEFTFVVNPEGDAHLQVYATDPSKAGKAGKAAKGPARRGRAAKGKAAPRAKASKKAAARTRVR